MSSLSFELDGTVYVVEEEDNKIVRTPLDGELVLKVLINALDKGLKDLEKECT